MKKVTLLLSFLLCVGMGAAQAQFKTLRSFADTTDGYEPQGALTMVGNKLYGMSYEGGTNYEGNIFSINTDGTGFTTLWSFSDTGSAGNCDGAYPEGNNLLLVGNKLYGMTYEGGYNNDGTIFSINIDGTNYKDLWDFSDTGVTGNASGYAPYGSLILLGNKLFGMTSGGGGNGDYGTIFSIDTNGNHYRDLWDFSDTGDGDYPYYGSLVFYGNKLFGFTEYGGSNNDGTAFSIDTNGTHYKDILDLDYNNSGDYLQGTPVLYNGKLFGCPDYGGPGGYGLVFSVDTNGANFTDLMDFSDGPEGGEPWASLTRSGNTLYSTTYEGGTNGDGTLFSVDVDGNNFTVLHTFSGYDGYEASANDPLISNGVLYNMDYGGGKHYDGSIYSMGLCGMFTANQITVDDTNNMCNGASTIVANGGPSPYTYKWSSGQTTATVTGMCAGSYDCTVTDANGCSYREVVIINNVLGVNNITADNGDVKLYPNPNNGTFTIDSRNLKKASTLSVYNAMGQAIYSSQLSANSSASAVDMSNAPAGVYFYRVVTQNGDLVNQGKIVIQK